jgi:hypothetical protein
MPNCHNNTAKWAIFWLLKTPGFIRFAGALRGTVPRCGLWPATAPLWVGFTLLAALCFYLPYHVANYVPDRLCWSGGLLAIAAGDLTSLHI